MVGPLARYSLNHASLSPLAKRGGRGRRPRRDLPQPLPEHRRPLRRDALRGRRGAAPDRSLRAAGSARGRGRAAGRRPARAGRRRRAGCSGTVTSWARTGGSRALGSSRRPPRTRPRSRTTCGASSRPTSTCCDEPLAVALRAGGSQLRPLHLLLDPLPAPRDRPRLAAGDVAAPRHWSSGWGTGCAATTARGSRSARLVSGAGA